MVVIDIIIHSIMVLICYTLELKNIKNYSVVVIILLILHIRK